MIRCRRAVVAAVLLGAATTGCASGDDAQVDLTAATTATAGTTASSSSSTTTDAPPTVATTESTAASSPPTTTDPVPVEPAARIVAEVDADGFATQLSRSHATMTDPDASAAERQGAGTEYQLLLRELADRPDLDEAVLNTAEPAAQPALTAIVRARQFLQERSAARAPTPLPDELPAWTVNDPESVDTLLAHYAEAESLTGIPWYWLAAIHLQETRMGRIEGVSSAGATGPMQFLPTTWAQCCTGDPTVSRDAIIGAATYLMQSGGPDDMAAAVFQYNPNDGYVAVVTAYAESLRAEPELYSGYHAFQVFFGTSAGTVRLPIGYSESAPIDAAAYLAEHPNDAA